MRFIPWRCAVAGSRPRSPCPARHRRTDSRLELEPLERRTLLSAGVVPGAVLPEAVAHHPSPHVHIVIHKKNGGTAVQNNTALTVTVSLPTGNDLNFFDDGSGNLNVTWNGGISHHFKGIRSVTIFVTAGTTNSTNYVFQNDLSSANSVRTISAELSGGANTFNLSGPSGVNVGPNVPANGNLTVAVDGSRSTGNDTFNLNLGVVAAAGQAGLLATGGQASNTIHETAVGTQAGTVDLSENTVGTGSGTFNANIQGTITGLVQLVQSGNSSDQINSSFSGQVASGTLRITGNGGETGNNTLVSNLTLDAPSTGKVDDTLTGRSPGTNTFTLTVQGSDPNEDLAIDGSPSSTQNFVEAFAAGVKFSNIDNLGTIPLPPGSSGG